jgi:hypothetical protein
LFKPIIDDLQKAVISAQALDQVPLVQAVISISGCMRPCGDGKECDDKILDFCRGFCNGAVQLPKKKAPTGMLSSLSSLLSSKAVVELPNIPQLPKLWYIHYEQEMAAATEWCIFAPAKGLYLDPRNGVTAESRPDATKALESLNEIKTPAGQKTPANEINRRHRSNNAQ